MTDRIHSCPDSPDGKHHWIPFIPYRPIQERAKAMSDKVGGCYQLEPALAIRIENQHLKAQLIVECEYCHSQKLGDEVPVPEGIEQRFHQTPHSTVM